jgi:hypothetical protein
MFVARTQLFYELTGTIFNGSAASPWFTNVLGEPLSANDIRSAFGAGVDGFVNSSTDANEVRKFMGSWRQDEIGRMKIGSKTNVFFALPADGPQSFTSLETDGRQRWVVPWCYDCSSTNRVNADSYDLWIDLTLGGKTNRICNWSDQPVIVAY